MSAIQLKSVSLGLGIFALIWMGGWVSWVVAQHNANKLDVAASILGFFLLGAVPGGVLVVIAGILWLRAIHVGKTERAAVLEMRIAEAVRTRGMVQLKNLASEWQMPESSIRLHLERLVGMQLLEGRVDWDKGIVYAPYAQPGQSCPRCGGEVKSVGKDLARCLHCGSAFPLETQD